MKFAALAALALGLFTIPVQASSLVLVLASKHINTDKPHQERNWGVGYQSGQWMGAVYRNSYGKPAAYGLYTPFRYRLSDDIHFSTPIGLVVGYDDRPVMPMVLPTLSWQATPRLTLDVGMLPPISGSGLIGLQMRIGL